MAMFQLSGLDEAPFQPLFDLSDEDLQARAMRRMVVDKHPGFPCRVSLQDAAIGEEVLLLPYTHLDAHSPYRSGGAIFVRRGAARAVLAPGEVPAYVTGRIISLRAYDAAHLMIHADVVDGGAVAETLAALFDDPAVEYVHLHNAKRGCFSSLAVRAPAAG